MPSRRVACRVQTWYEVFVHPWHCDCEFVTLLASRRSPADSVETQPARYCICSECAHAWRRIRNEHISAHKCSIWVYVSYGTFLGFLRVDLRTGEGVASRYTSSLFESLLTFCFERTFVFKPVATAEYFAGFDSSATWYRLSVSRAGRNLRVSGF